MKQQVKISKVKGNPNNPRIIKNDKFIKLVKSIQEFPEMLELRPIVVDEDMVVLGGNMRLKASKAAGLKEVWIEVAEGLTEEQKQEFIVKDNVGFGEWEWDMLANEWDSVQLAEWGLDVWQDPEPEAEVKEEIYTKDIKAPEVKTIDTTEGQKNTNKVKSQKIDIVNKDPKTGKDVKVGETNTSSRPDSEGPVTKEPKPNETKTEAKAEKKGLWGRYRDHVTNADGKGSYAKTQDSINELANVVGSTKRHSTDNFEKVNINLQKEKDAKAKEIATADANKKDTINAQQKAEMHNSQLAVNEQNIASAKALEAQRLQGVKIAEENVSKEKELEETEPKAIIKGGGNNQKVKTALDK